MSRCETTAEKLIANYEGRMTGKTIKGPWVLTTAEWLTITGKPQTTKVFLNHVSWVGEYLRNRGYALFNLHAECGLLVVQYTASLPAVLHGLPFMAESAAQTAHS